MIPNPWILLGIVLTWIASLVAVGGWQHSAGVTSERNANRGVQIEELKAANAEIKKLEEAARASEHEHAEQLAAIGAAHEADIEAHRIQAEKDVADARSGAKRLRDPGATGCPAGGGVPAAPAAPGERDGPAPGELSREAGAFLYQLVNDADAVVEQLASCQAVVRSYVNPVKGAAP